MAKRLAVVEPEPGDLFEATRRFPVSPAARRAVIRHWTEEDGFEPEGLLSDVFEGRAVPPGKMDDWVHAVIRLAGTAQPEDDSDDAVYSAAEEAVRTIARREQARHLKNPDEASYLAQALSMEDLAQELEAAARRVAPGVAAHDAGLHDINAYWDPEAESGHPYGVSDAIDHIELTEREARAALAALLRAKGSGTQAQRRKQVFDIVEQAALAAR